MKRKQLFTALGASLGMLFLILDGKTALKGAQDGISLCIQTLIPSLFPFFVLSILLTSAIGGSSLPPLQFLCRLCRLPAGTEGILLTGFLGGYPVGAQCVAQAWRFGNLKKEDAQRMLGFCSNAGPAFIFGMLSTMFSNRLTAWLLWGIHILSAILTAWLLPGGGGNAASFQNEVLSPSQALSSALRAMGTVCGWVILFRILLAFLEQWLLWFFPIPLQVLLTGILELANGCCQLPSIESESLRLLIASVSLALGGLCVTMQTISVCSGLSLRCYWIGKTLQSVFSLILCLSVITGTWGILLLVLTIAMLLSEKQKKAVAFNSHLLYNDATS